MSKEKNKKPEPDKKLKDVQMGLTSDKNLESPETDLAISPKKAKGTTKELSEERERKTEIKIKQIQREEEEQRAKDLASKLGLPYIDLRTSLINDRALILANEEQSRQTKVVIFQKRQKELYVAVFDPNFKATKSFVESLENQAFQTKIFITSQSNLEKAWKRYKILKVKKAKITKTAEIDIERLKEIQEEIANIKDLKEKINRVDLTATQLLNTIMAAGLKLEASDVHLETEAQEKTRLRFRIDGILQDVTDILSSSYQLLLSRIKILSSLKLNVHNVPQDGRFSFKTEGKEIEIRTSIIPAEYGENIVMRILDPKAIGLKLEDLGIQDHDFKIITSQLKKPNGMIITTGPTGSGKTTILYAFLKKVNRPEIKIITLENPIEYHLEGIEQTQVNADKGYTFAAGLRSIVRQDPDMILVGEIRDKETAETAINAALTGHLVFSTLHTNDAAGAVPRMVDMKVNPNLIPPALNIVIAQRLIRKACKKCTKEVKPDKETLEKIKDGLKDLPKRAKKPELEDIKILLIHQKLTGHLLVGKWMFRNKEWKSISNTRLKEKVNQYIHLMFYLSGPTKSGAKRMLGLSDLRKFGKALVVDNKDLENLEDIKNLGPEPLAKNFTFNKFRQALENKEVRPASYGRGKIKQVLMNQNVIAGIGNIYSDEILFEARIHPLKQIQDLRDDDLKRIYNSIKKILRRAIVLRGDSMSDYRDVKGRKGRYQEVQKVYQREGQKCYRCGGIIKRIKIGGRSAHYCPACQKL